MVCPICGTDCKDAVICPNCEWDLAVDAADVNIPDPPVGSYEVIDGYAAVDYNRSASIKGNNVGICSRCGSHRCNVRLIVNQRVRPYESARLYRYNDVFFKALALIVHVYFWLPKIKKGYVCKHCGYKWVV